PYSCSLLCLHDALPIFIQVIASLVFIFLLIPLIIIVVTSFGTAATVQFPIQGFTLDWYLVVFQSDTFKQSFVTSLIVGLIAVVRSEEHMSELQSRFDVV